MLTVVCLTASIYGWERIFVEYNLARITFFISVDSTNADLYAERMRYDGLYGPIKYANNDVEKHIELGGKDPNVHFSRGMEYYSSNKLEAIKYFTNAITFGRDVYVLRGSLYLETRQYNLAILDFKKALELNPSEEARYFLAVCYSILGQYDQSINLFLKGRHYYYVVEQLILLDKLKEAIIYQDSVPKYLSGLINYKIGNYKPAKLFLELSLKNDSMHYMSEYVLGKIYLREGSKNKALQHLERSMQKGFGFFDILSEDDDYSKLQADDKYIALVSKYHKVKTDDIQNKMNKVLKKDTAFEIEKHNLVNNRMEAILTNSIYKSEYKKLFQLKHEFSFNTNAP